MYQTLKAVVRRGRIELLDDVALPESASALVTILEEVQPETLTLGEHLQRGLTDVARQRSTRVSTAKQLQRHLDHVFAQAD
jgi:hypothetical protein